MSDVVSVPSNQQNLEDSIRNMVVSMGFNPARIQASADPRSGRIRILQSGHRERYLAVEGNVIPVINSIREIVARARRGE